MNCVNSYKRMLENQKAKPSLIVISKAVRHCCIRNCEKPTKTRPFGITAHVVPTVSEATQHI